MDSRTARIPITLYQKQQRTTNPSHDIHETPKKKIVINRRVVPKITIRVDELIRDTFHGLANDRLRYVTDSEDVLNNKILIDYIMAIYETYDIEDPLRKYKENVPLMTHQEEEPEEQSTTLKHQSLIRDSLGHTRLVESKYGTTEREHKDNTVFFNKTNKTLANTFERENELRSSSKRKIQKLKDSIRDVGYEPVEVRTIELSTNKRSASSIKRQIMFGTPEKEDSARFMNGVELKQSKFSHPQGQDYTKITQAHAAGSKLSSYASGPTNLNNFIENATSSYMLANPYKTNPSGLLGSTLEVSNQEKRKKHEIRSASVAKQEGQIHHLFLQRHTSQVEPTFRFCFMCENPILEANISLHEQKCPRFLDLYSIDCEEIVKILVSKISRLKGEIRDSMKADQQLPDEPTVERSLRNSVNLWMSRVQQAQQSGMQGNDYEHSYNSIVKVFQRPCFHTLELTYKLKWFLRIREQIKNKFSL